MVPGLVTLSAGSRVADAIAAEATSAGIVNDRPARALLAQPEPEVPTDEELLRVAATDATDYERIHRSRISRLPGVQRIQSSLALRTVKGWAGYPI